MELRLKDNHEVRMWHWGGVRTTGIEPPHYTDTMAPSEVKGAGEPNVPGLEIKNYSFIIIIIIMKIMNMK